MIMLKLFPNHHRVCEAYAISFYKRGFSISALGVHLSNFKGIASIVIGFMSSLPFLDCIVAIFSIQFLFDSNIVGLAIASCAHLLTFFYMALNMFG